MQENIVIAPSAEEIIIFCLYTDIRAIYIYDEDWDGAFCLFLLDFFILMFMIPNFFFFFFLPFAEENL